MIAGKGLAASQVSGGWDLVNATPLSKVQSILVSGQDTSCTDFFFKPDGTAMYIIGVTNDTVYQYTLSSPWDITSALYASKSFSVGGQELTPQALFFKPDGTAMYIVGTSQYRVYQYTLSTAWDVSTASYASKNAIVQTQEGAPNGLFFKTDGTAMYVVGQSSDAVFQYTLSTAWDVSTASYASKSFSVLTQEGVPSGLFFNATGTTMYVIGGGNIVYQYQLATAWDVSTAAYFLRSASFNNASQGLFISSAGDVLFIISTTTVFQFPMQVAFNVSSAYYRIKEFSPANVSSINDLAISTDGLNLYLLSSVSDSVIQFSLTTAFDISTTIATNKSVSIAASDTAPSGLFFKPDGTAMYVIGTVSDAVWQYTLSTAWDVSTATYSSKAFLIQSQEATPSAVTFKIDGTSMYVIGITNDTVFQYNLSTAWDVSTASYANKSRSVASRETAPAGLAFKSDGTAMYVIGSLADNIQQYTLSTPWDVATSSVNSTSQSPYAGSSAPNGLSFSSDGAYAYISSSSTVYQMQFPTPWSTATGYLSFIGSSYYGCAFLDSLVSFPADLFFKPDGTTIYILDNTSDTVYQYTLTTPGDITTTVYSGKSFVFTQDGTPQGIFFKNDGTAMYIIGSATDNVYEYTLSTAWDIATASYASKTISIAGQEGTPSSLFFKPDGTVMYVSGSTSDRVYQYTLSTAWDVSTATYASKFFQISQEGASTGLFFKSDGTAAYVIGTTNDTVFQYNMTTPWDVSTASYSSISYSTVPFDTTPQGICFNATGTRMYMAGASLDTVFQFNTE